MADVTEIRKGVRAFPFMLVMNRTTMMALSIPHAVALYKATLEHWEVLEEIGNADIVYALTKAIPCHITPSGKVWQGSRATWHPGRGEFDIHAPYPRVIPIKST